MSEYKFKIGDTGLTRDGKWEYEIVGKGFTDIYPFRVKLINIETGERDEQTNTIIGRILIDTENCWDLMPPTTASPKWTPGQKLNSVAEVMQALLDQQILFSGYKPFQLREDGKFYFLGEDRPIAVHLSSSDIDETYIYSPPVPKRKIRTERWFAVYEPKWLPDPTWEGIYLTEDEARKACPNALTYVRAEWEGEVEG